MLGEFAALGSAFCWTLGPLLALTPLRMTNVAVFSRVRFLAAFVIMAALALVTGGWAQVQTAHLLPLILSGVVGYAFGDYWLMSGVRILGPRRAGILFTVNAPITAGLGILLFDKPMTWIILAGSALALSGVIIALAYRAPSAGAVEAIEGRIGRGILAVLLGALGQAGGLLLAKPAMDTGADPLAASAIRLSIAALIFALPALVRFKWPDYAMPRQAMIGTIAHAVVGPAIGVALMMLALAQTSAGLAAVLASLSPVMILPILRLYFGERLHPLAWAGAFLSVIGTAMLILR